MDQTDLIHWKARKRVEDHLDKMAETFERERDNQWDVTTHREWSQVLNHTLNQLRKLPPLDIDLPEDEPLDVPQAAEKFARLQDMAGKMRLKLGS